MTMNWIDIGKAPKCGTQVWLCWMDDGVPNDVVKMGYDHNMVNGMIPDVTGMWVDKDKTCTWTDHYGAGPTHFSYVT